MNISERTIQGKTWKLGDDVNTDLIIAGKYKLSITDIDELASHTLEGVIDDFSLKVSEGDIIVAGKNFGCGSSREQAPLVLKHLGISAVVAKSFARIFFRNAINLGLPVLECQETFEIDDGETLEIDLTKGQILIGNKNIILEVKQFPEVIRNILYNGGLVDYVKKFKKLPW